mmetsp:Transcript_47395/g.151275  ORF Transcript_47395/g.151275 Transcript_47395/m.151275 type:complete len:272 (-) Transcript_47395:6-821(-)
MPQDGPRGLRNAPRARRPRRRRRRRQPARLLRVQRQLVHEGVERLRCPRRGRRREPRRLGQPLPAALLPLPALQGPSQRLGHSLLLQGRQRQQRLGRWLPQLALVRCPAWLPRRRRQRCLVEHARQQPGHEHPRALPVVAHLPEDVHGVHPTAPQGLLALEHAAHARRVRGVHGVEDGPVQHARDAGPVAAEQPPHRALEEEHADVAVGQRAPRLAVRGQLPDPGQPAGLHLGGVALQQRPHLVRQRAQRRRARLRGADVVVGHEADVTAG